MTTTIPPGRNPTLALAWKLHKAAQRSEGKRKPEPTPEPIKSKNAKPPRAKGGKTTKGKK